MITATNLCKTVSVGEEQLTILDSVSLNIEAGSSAAIVGASGSGKSTLLALLAGLDSATAGAILLDGDDISAMDEEARARIRAQKTGFVFQSFHLLPGLTALENVMLPLEIKGDNAADEKARHYLKDVGLLERLNHFPRQLSGGEQQRVAIARAFVSAPKILFADEPTGNLDSVTGAHIIDLLFDLNDQQNTTLVLVTHEERLAARCQQQIVLQAGRVVSERLNSSDTVDSARNESTVGGVCEC